MSELDHAALASVVDEIVAEVEKDLAGGSHSVLCMGVSVSSGTASATRVETTNSKLANHDKPTFGAVARRLLRANAPAGPTEREPWALDVDLRQAGAVEIPDSLPSLARYFYALVERVAWDPEAEQPPVRVQAWVFTASRPSTPFSPLTLRSMMDRLVGTVRIRFGPPSHDTVALAIRSGAMRDGLAAMARLRGLEGVALWQYDETKRRLTPVASSGIGDTPLGVPAAVSSTDDIRRGVVSQVRPNRRPVIYDSEDPSLWEPPWDGLWEPFDKALFNKRGWRSCIAVPIVCSGRLVGALSAYSSRPADSLRDQAATLADDAAMCGDTILVRRERDVIAKLASQYDDELLTANVSLSALSLVHDILHYYHTVSGHLEQSEGYAQTNQISSAVEELQSAQMVMRRTQPAIEAMRKLAGEARDPESSKGPPVTSDPRSVLAEMGDVLRALLPQFSKHKRLDPDGVHVAVHGEARPVGVHPMTMERIIVNLCVNAAQWGSSQVWVDAHFDRREDEVDLVVRDDGNGIPPSQRSRVFDRFHSGRSGGSGLGLYVVRELATRVGGEAYVQSYHRSEEGIDQPGTVVTVVLPAKAVDG